MTVTSFSLRTRLMVAFAVVMLLVLGLPAYYLNQNLTSVITQEARDNVNRDLRAVDWMLVSHRAASLGEIDAAMRELAARMNIRITYVAEDGGVLLDSGVSLDQVGRLENHAARPEVVEALNGTLGMSMRYSDTLGQRLIYAARRSSGQGVIPPGVLRIAQAQTMVRDSLDRLTGRVGWVYLLGVCVAFGLVSLVSRQVAQAIANVAQAAASIGRGETGRRIRLSPGKELVPLVSAFNHMAERVEESMRVITKQKMETEAVFNGMKAGVIVLDGRGHILRGNYAAQEIFPGLSTFAGKKPMEMSLIRELQAGCDAALERRRGGDFSQVNLVVTLNDGQVFDVSIVPIKGDAELGAIMVFHDITEIKKVERIRRDFVANVSHELRTPLTSIKGYAETLIGLDAHDPEQAKAFLEVILRNANHMNTMLDELLQLSKLEHGKQRVDMVAVDPFSALYSAWKSCQPLRREVDFVNEVAEGGPAVRGNFEQVVQVFRNVLENALKYVPEDAPRIRVFSRREGNMLNICIEDNGPGIPVEDQGRIFERFYRVEKDRNSAVGGTGLGLAICRHILAGHNGAITVQSPVPETGVGSRFIIGLPLAGQPSEE